MEVINAQQTILELVDNADSWEIVSFLKNIAKKLGSEECHNVRCHYKNRMRKEDAKARRWKGPIEETASSHLRKLFRMSEDPAAAKEEKVDVPAPLELRSSALRSTVPGAWWEQHEPENIISFDTEHVHLKGIKTSKRIRAGKVGVVNFQLSPIYETEVYHAADTFEDNNFFVAISGIGKEDLVHGQPMKNVTEKMKEIFTGKLIIYFGGEDIDFKSLDLEIEEWTVFNLQSYYKRVSRTGDICNMSLRDAYFLEFNLDFQGTAVHSATMDAKATMKLFKDGYMKRMCTSLDNDKKDHFNVFHNAVSLNDMKKEGKQFCNLDQSFKPLFSCKCLSCLKRFPK